MTAGPPTFEIWPHRILPGLWRKSRSAPDEDRSPMRRLSHEHPGLQTNSVVRLSADQWPAIPP
jgi:hypothetical protein